MSDQATPRPSAIEVLENMIREQAAQKEAEERELAALRSVAEAARECVAIGCNEPELDRALGKLAEAYDYYESMRQTNELSQLPD